MKVSQYSFDAAHQPGLIEPAATLLVDYSRNKIDGTMLDGHPDWVQLPSGLWVQSYDGVADHANMGDNREHEIRTGDEFTIKMWVYPLNEQSANNDVITDKKKNFRYIWGNPGNGTLRGTIRLWDDTAGGWVETGVGMPLGANNWWLIIGTWDGAWLRNYADGVEQNSLNVGAITMGNSAGNWEWGCNATLGAHYYGYIALQEVLRRCWSATECAEVYDREKYLFGKS